jgi:ribosome biogenesis protein ENP2
MSNVQVSEINGLKIYNLTGGKSLYDMIKESDFNYKKLKKNDDYINRIEIIQEFEFPASAGCLRVSNDGNYIMASGIYPPRMKIYELNEMTLKCERGFDSEIRKIEIISDDYSKAAYLCEDRNIEIHAQYGKHFKIRIPKYGRDIIYHKTNCDLFTVGNTNEIYRLNLFEGQFLNPFISNAEAINACSINYNYELLGIAGEKGVVELWDLKDRKRVAGMPMLDDSIYRNYE